MERNYHFFVAIHSGMPLIVPDDNALFKMMFDKTYVYSHVYEGTAEECIDKQIEHYGKQVFIPKH